VLNVLRSLLGLGSGGAGRKALSPADDEQMAAELAAYASHAAILSQVGSFITQIMATIGFYVTVTGAVWGIAAADRFNIGLNAVVWILGMHVALSLGVAASLKGLGASMIQRLEFAKEMGGRFWPGIVQMGDDAWRGPLPAFTLRTQRFWYLLPLAAIFVSFYLVGQACQTDSARTALCRTAARSLVINRAPPPDHAVIERDRYIFDKAGCSSSFLAGDH
jgi:hypothetical protein